MLPPSPGPHRPLAIPASLATCCGVAVPLARSSPRYRTHVSRKRSRSGPREGGSDMVPPPGSQPLLQVLPPRLPPALPFAAAGPAEGPGLKDRSCRPRQQGASANSPAHRSPSPWLGFYRLIFFTVFSGVARLAPSSSSTDCGVAAKGDSNTGCCAAQLCDLGQEPVTSLSLTLFICYRRNWTGLLLERFPGLITCHR